MLLVMAVMVSLCVVALALFAPSVRKSLLRLGVGVGAAMAVPSFATGLDYSTITGAVDYTTVATAILTVFGLGAVAILAWKGGAMVLSAIRKG